MNKLKNKTPTKKKDHYQKSGGNNMSFYKTPDLYLSAFLKSNGIILQGIDKENSKVIFIFKNDGSVKNLLDKYFNDSKVGVLTYKAALRDLRSIIFNYENFMFRDGV